MNEYVHGYSEDESVRLDDQAQVLRRLLHADVHFPEAAKVLEVGCGTGAQTVILAHNNPAVHFTSVDISEGSLMKAAAAVTANKFTNVKFAQQDIYELEFADDSFDHLFCCFVLEHLADPELALARVKRVLKPGGTITVIEGDHGSFFCHPYSDNIAAAVNCLVRLQHQKGGDALIGRRLYPLLSSSGFDQVEVRPRTVYADSSLPDVVSGFSENTFIAMVAGIRDEAIASGLITEETWQKAMADFDRAVGREGTFCYTFFKAVGRKWMTG
jgi:SAM-dependent methyltransferase